MWRRQRNSTRPNLRIRKAAVMPRRPKPPLWQFGLGLLILIALLGIPFFIPLCCYHTLFFSN